MAGLSEWCQCGASVMQSDRGLCPLEKAGPPVLRRGPLCGTSAGGVRYQGYGERSVGWWPCGPLLAGGGADGVRTQRPWPGTTGEWLCTLQPRPLDFRQVLRSP